MLLQQLDEELLDRNDAICEWLQEIFKIIETKYKTNLKKTLQITDKRVLLTLLLTRGSGDNKVDNILNNLQKEGKERQLAEIIKSLEARDKYLFGNKLCWKLHKSNHLEVLSVLKLLLVLIKEDCPEICELAKRDVMNLFHRGKLLSNKWQECYLLAANFLLQNSFRWDIFTYLYPFIILSENNREKLFNTPFFIHSEFGKPSRDFLAHIANKMNPKLFEDFLDNCTKENISTQYSTLAIMAQIFPKISSLDTEIIKKAFVILDECCSCPQLSMEEGEYVKIAMKHKLPLKGALENLKLLISNALEEQQFNWVLIDFIQHPNYATFTSCMCNLFVKRSNLNILNFFLKRLSSKASDRLAISLNICVSGILDCSTTCQVLTCVIEMLASIKTSNNALFINSYLLVLASNSQKKIRTLVVKLLKQLPPVLQKAKWIERILSHEKEIISDPDQMCLLIGNDSSLLKATCSQQAPIYLQEGLLNILPKDSDFVVLETLCQHFLEQFKTETDFNEYHTKIFANLITRLDSNVLPNITLDTSVWQVMLFVLTNLKINNLHSALLKQLSKHVWKLPDGILEKLLDLICQVTITNEDPQFLTLANKIFKHIDLDAKIVVNLLKPAVETTKQVSKIRRSRSAFTIDNLAWKKSVCLLEFIQGKKKIRQGQLLLPVLFDTLKKCLDFDEQAAVEYPKQLILSLVLLVCRKQEDDDENITVSEHFNVELVVQCIRASQNPQTHYHALLTLAEAAKIVPQQVLHHVMTVFTFMGSTLVRQDDAYSFEIISKIIDEIIPILIRGNSNVNTATIPDVLRVFVDALLDVPEHRRISLYTKLFNKLGASENFYLFILFVHEAEVSQIIKGKKKNEKGATSRAVEIALQLAEEFSVNTILQSAITLTKYINNLPNNITENTMQPTFKNSPVNINNFTMRQFRHYKYLIILFLNKLLSSRSLIKKIALLSDNESVNIEPYCKECIINILTYIQRTQKLCESTSNTTENLYWKAILHNSHDLLDNINSLLTNKMFLLVIKGLMAHSMTAVKKRALELLNNKLQLKGQQYDQEDLYVLLKPILLVVESYQSNIQSDKEEILVQTALLSLKLIVKTLGAERPDNFLQILDVIVNLLKQVEKNVLASVILCLAELCAQLRAHAIAKLPNIMPTFLKVLKNQRKETSSMLLLSVTTTISKLLDNFGAFLSPYLPKLISEVSYLMSKWNYSANEDPKVQPLILRFNNIKKKLSQVIPPRLLIPTINECYEVLQSKQNYTALVPLVDILEEQIKILQSSEVSNHGQELTAFFLKALEFRSTASDLPLETIKPVEEQVVKTLTTFTLKLSENSFRPFYMKLFEWAFREENNPERLITFYHLSNRIGDSLKGLFTLFAASILGNTSEILRTITKIFPDSKDKRDLLLEYVLKTLQIIFIYDNKQLINRDRFDMLMQPLVDLLETNDDLERNIKLITPTIVSFALAVSDDILWKQINYQVLLKMRHHKSDVRLMALHCLTEIVSKLKEDFMPLLPETVPFLAELLEDEDEQVEKAGQTAIREMEKVLGEPLQKYF